MGDLAIRDREDVIVEYPNDMDDQTLVGILGSFVIEVAEEKPKPPKKEPRPPELGGFWRVYESELIDMFLRPNGPER
jgi:hypothetical protein